MATSRKVPTHVRIRTLGGDAELYDYVSAVAWAEYTKRALTSGYTIQDGGTAINLRLASQADAESFKVGDVVYVWSGTLADPDQEATRTVAAIIPTGLGAPSITLDSMLPWTPELNDHVTASEVLRAYNKGSDYEEGAQVVLVDALGNADFHRIIQGVDPKDKPTFLHDTGATLRSAEDYGRIYDCDAMLNANAPTARRAIRINNCDQAAVVGCKATCTNVGAGGAYGIESNLPDGAASYIINCDARASGQEAIHIESAAGSNTHMVSSCTGRDAQTVIFVASGTCIVKNTLGAGLFTGSFDAASDYNANQQAAPENAPPGAHSRYNQDFIFVNEGLGDFRLAVNDAGARRFGTDLSADGNWAFDDDINGETRPAGLWDIGAYQCVMATPIFARKPMEVNAFGGVGVR